ncbi:hypothetical protein HHTV1_71 [Haloarcula hispanica tailed virus 1]|uniref:Uncharacterized protein n=1 Tax=Haloarcula hispanica tailed virus 1 TaxID=1273750 RepID=R4T8V4_9CAUD|nr:hypothetical protein M198_gp69 [Haloarcula hispanica tailed virus 1]AGM11330.1 hypothetical protein HHTV1_71 [Haloarcula hispanica tailed virus 1]
MIDPLKHTTSTNDGTREGIVTSITRRTPTGISVGIPEGNGPAWGGPFSHVVGP